MAPTIFYSWQSDSNKDTNHDFIKKCLEEAVKQLKDQGTVEEAPRVDHDMKEVYGDEDVFQTILNKIRECDIFVADISIVGKTPNGKFLPNPNVLLELGYALNSVGTKRIIKIMNTAYGKPEGLPFDMAHKRWPYQYELKDTATAQKRENMIPKVANHLAEIIQGMLGVGSLKQTLFNETQSVWNSSSFINDGILGNYNHPALDEPMPIRWENGPQWFLRVIPANSFKDMTSRKALDYITSSKFFPFGRCPGISKMVNEWGATSFEQGLGGKPTPRMTQLFRLGEIWGIEKASSYNLEHKVLVFPYLITVFTEGITGYLSFMQEQLKILPPVKIIAGISDIAGFSLSDPRFAYDKASGHCPQNEIIFEIVLPTFYVDVKDILSPFFQKIWEEFTLPGSWEPQT